MSAKDVSSILRQAGFRYSGKGLQYDTYLEVQSATESAGKDFISRVNKKIKELEKSGQDTLYNVQKAVKDDLKNNGILNVEYKGGRKVSLDSYARMAVRSARMESKNIGAFGRALENGTDYVKCTTIFPTCEICAKYQGKIYSISGKDNRFPALFETALHHGYALMHPNCRHEFIPVWIETFDEKELEREIRNSEIVDNDVRSVKERNEYAAWQDKQRQEYHERQYFEQAKKTLGNAMPYKDLAAFRRSYRTKEDSFAHKRSHNLLRDYKEYQTIKDVLKDESPETLAKFQEIKYNNSSGNYQKLKETFRQERDYQTAVVGGVHSGKYFDFVNNYTDKQLEKSIRSYDETIREHLDKIDKPEEYIQDWNIRDERYKIGIIKKWRKDVKRNIAERNIAIRLLKRRKEDENKKND